MSNTLTRWIERKLAERYEDPWHECERCSDIDSTHDALSNGEIVCWHCAEQAGEFEVPHQMEWRIDQI
jgi:formylmethanofuran dehydrogenase subunit E